MLTLLSPEDRIYELISQWLASYVMRPHPELGRRGPVCPFVARALTTGSVSVAAYQLGPDPDLERMNLAVEQGAECFRELVREEENPDLVSLIVAFPDLGREHWHLIDDGHRASKTRFVQNGLMLGQFHPSCDAPAVHNAAFPVNRAPLPLMVVRNMAPHDILFLEQEPAWLDHYKVMLERRKITVDSMVYRRRYERAVGRGTT